ncbi:Thyroglobulin [Collichthys lucidus]|uniref:Thyroglobulin n=1 Tax=Collichthys lucidus TaxID=240159 RepID=A0A4U5V609_COLLU|nr:Thyroglobulin [Collichthys lucidus]
MAWLLRITCILVCCLELLQGKASEYQLESESLSQCELLRGVAVARQSGDVPQCTEDGRFRGQCWCVDQDGMELYGTRQSGSPLRCPGSCEVRSRRLLHASASHSPPQCAEDGSFLPVQCRFINMTDRTEVDLLHAFNRVGTMWNSLARFEQNLLVSLSGPSPCEEERRVAMEASSVFVPSCETSGSFTSRQCQQGGQCWCVDPTGRELPGTRQHGDSLVCGSGPVDCLSQRRLALSRLFSGPVDPPNRASSGTSPSSSLSLVRPLKELLPVEADPISFLSHLTEVLHGLFPSVGGALQALARSSPRRLQENLFGGKFLKNAASFNFSGAVGQRGALGLDHLSSQTVSLQKNQELVQSVSRALEDPAFLSALQQTLRGLSGSQSVDEVHKQPGTVFIPSCTLGGGFQEVQCGGAECWCVDPRGQEVEGSRAAGRRPRCPSRCERERATALKVRENMAAGAEIHIPACSEDGDFLPLQCVGSRCFCVDGEGKRMLSGSAGGAITCVDRSTVKRPPSAGRCSEALAEVTAFIQEVKRIVTLSNSSHLPLGYGFLLAEGLRLTPEELQTSQSEEELQISDRLLSRSNAALRLAAFSKDGQEVGGTRTPRQTGGTPSCDRRCRLLVEPQRAATRLLIGCCSALQVLFAPPPPFPMVHWCVTPAGGRQSCDLVCHRGYQNSLPVSSFLCDVESLRWDGAQPLGGACQIGVVLALGVFVIVVLSDQPSTDSAVQHDDQQGLCSAQGLLGNIRSELTSEPKLVSMETAVFGCSRGYRLSGDGEGCVVCPPGSFSSEGACLLCPEGTYQDEEGRDFCDRCPRGSSPAGASSVNQCVTECQRRGLRCSERGDFLSAQPDFLSGRWRCVDSEGTKGFLGNPQAELFDWLSCSLRVRGGASGAESPSGLRMMKALSGVFRTQVFSGRTSLSDAHRFCQDGCRRDACCDGFILNQNTLNGGSLLCGWLRAPSVLMCGDQDWDMIGQGAANRICGAGLTYNEQQKNFLFDFGGQTFAITDSALPPDSKNKKDYQASIVSFQRVYLNTDTNRKLPSLSFWLNKNNYDSQQALLWCLSRCDAEPLCSVADLRDADSAGFFSCSLLPDSRVCGAYDKPLRRACMPPPAGHQAQQHLQQEGFMQCERRCDEDPCCRGIGFVRDTSTVSLDHWTALSDSSFLVDPSVSTYDVIHVSRDIATDRGETRDWCLHACQEAESCVAVTISEVESATRCVLYPDTTACGLSSAPSSSSHTSSCRLVIREPAPQVYLRTGEPISQSRRTVTQSGAGQTLCFPHQRGCHWLRPSPSRDMGRCTVSPWKQPWAQTGRRSFSSWESRTPVHQSDHSALKLLNQLIGREPGTPPNPASNEDCLYLNVFTPAAQRGRVPVLVYFFNPPANQNPGLLDGSALAAVGNIVVVTASYRTAALGFLSTGVSGSSGLHGNYGLSDQEAVLRWVHAHISLVGGDSGRVTVGAERGGADITSLHLLSSSSSSPLLFQRMMLMGGSVFSPSLVQTPPTSRRQAIALAKELGCVTSDLDDGELAACLRAAPVGALNAAQTKLLAVSGPFQSWSPLRPSVSQPSLRRVDLLLGTSEHDGLLGRARRIKDFEALQGRADGKTAFYEALSRSLGGATGSDVLKEAAAWFYSLDHSPSAAGYNLFSRALNNATRDLFIICPALQMASHWANSKANIFLYHQPAASAHDRAEPSVPLDLQFVFGTPYHPMSSQRFTSSDRRLSVAMMTYVSSFVRTGNPNPSRVWAESILPRWQQVLSSEAPPTYLELSPALENRQGLSQSACSFWSQLGPKLTGQTDSLRGRHGDYVQVLDSLRGRHRHYVQVLDSLLGRHGDYVQVLDSLRGRHGDYVQVLDSLRGRHGDYVQVLDSLRGRHRDYVQVLDSLRGRHGDYVQVSDSLRGRHGVYSGALFLREHPGHDGSVPAPAPPPPPPPSTCVQKDGDAARSVDRSHRHRLSPTADHMSASPEPNVATSSSPNSSEHHTTNHSLVTTATNAAHTVPVSPGNNTHTNSTSPTTTTSNDTMATRTVSPNKTESSQSVAPPLASGSGVPGWGIALLVLAALVLLLLILLLIGLLVWCCCYRGRYKDFSPYDHLTHRDDIPLYTTHSHFEGPNGRPYEELDKPMKNRTGIYTVNQ